ncbi:MAG: Sec-independent protein translocase protein TatB [Legionellales bacterium]|nr:Sec-independent protein translocase protein TatB [Legionellales bacterium]
MGIGELLIILIIALIVLGPERLPEIAKKAGQLWHKFTEFNQHIKQDLSEEMNLAQLKRNTELAEKAEKKQQEHS